MPKQLFFTLFGFALLASACTNKPSKVELMRQQKAQKDSITYANAQQNMYYSDSLLQVLLPQADQLMKLFVYDKDEKAEDHGHYVHRLLQTTRNTERNFLQAYIADNRQVSIQSYYYGSKKHNQRSLRISVGEDYVEKEGHNHAFNVEGWYELLTIEGEDALQLLAFITNHQQERIKVLSRGNQEVVYILTPTEKQALVETYQLASLMRNVDALERAIHVANLQIQKYEKKQDECK